MNIYQVRLFKNNGWHVIRSYAVIEEAQEWASGLAAEWDIKTISLAKAVA